MAFKSNLKDASDNLRQIVHDPDLSDVEDILERKILKSPLKNHLNRRVYSLDDLLAEDLPENDSEVRYSDYSDGSLDAYVP